VPGERLFTFATALPSEDADAIVLLATDLPTFSDIERIEAATGRPVLTFNQTILWHALRLCGVTDRVQGLGRLFAH
jgi:maleate isomerase